MHSRLPDGGALIVDSRFNRVCEHLDLSPAENILYEFCDGRKPFKAVAEQAVRIGYGEAACTRKLLDAWVDARVTVCDGDSFLSVAPVATTLDDGAELVDMTQTWLAISA